MLQVDPNKRIRIDDLLRHPWLINETYSEPVKYESVYQVAQFFQQSIQLLSFFVFFPRIN